MIGIITLILRGVAQLGSAAGLGPVGRRFESYHPEICACSSAGLECIATNDEVGGSNPSRRVIMLIFYYGGRSSAVEPWFVVPVVVGSNPIVHPKRLARVAELVDALDLGSSTFVCESSSLSSRNLTNLGV